MPDIALRLEAVSHVFHPDTPNEVRALDGVDLELERGTLHRSARHQRVGKVQPAQRHRRQPGAHGGEGLTGWTGRDPLAGAAAGPPDQPGIPEPVHRHRVGPECRREPRARGRTRRAATGSDGRWDATAGAAFGSRGPSRHGPRGPARHADRVAVGRPAPGAHGAHGHAWCGRRSCCSTSIPPRSIPGARSRSSDSRGRRSRRVSSRR